MAFCNFKTYNGRENERNVICFLSMENTVPQFLVQTAMHGSWFLNNRKWSGNYKGGGAVLVKHIKENDMSAGFYSSKSSSLNSGCWPIFQIFVVVNESQKNINRDNVSVVSQCFLPPPPTVCGMKLICCFCSRACVYIYLYLMCFKSFLDFKARSGFGYTHKTRYQDEFTLCFWSFYGALAAPALLDALHLHIVL